MFASAIDWVARFIGHVQIAINAACFIGLMGWMPVPPIGDWSFEVIVIVGMIAVSVTTLTALRILAWFVTKMLTRTGWLGREFGLAMIRGLTETRGKSWTRDTLVRWLWARVGTGRKLKSVATIAKRVRKTAPKRAPKFVPANDDREFEWIDDREAA